MQSQIRIALNCRATIGSIELHQEQVNVPSKTFIDRIFTGLFSWKKWNVDPLLLLFLKKRKEHDNERARKTDQTDLWLEKVKRTSYINENLIDSVHQNGDLFVSWFLNEILISFVGFFLPKISFNCVALCGLLLKEKRTEVNSKLKQETINKAKPVNIKVWTWWRQFNCFVEETKWHKWCIVRMKTRKKCCEWTTCLAYKNNNAHLKLEHFCW